MNKQTRIDTGHVGELLSGYVDGELTQQDSQRVRLHLEGCDTCRTTLEDLTALRERLGNASLGAADTDSWRESVDDPGAKAIRGTGWVLFIAGLMAVGGVGLYHFVFENSLATWQKLIVFAIYGGLGILLISVLRQRLIERKNDRYKDVEI